MNCPTTNRITYKLNLDAILVYKSFLVDEKTKNIVHNVMEDGYTERHLETSTCLTEPQGKVKI